MTQKLCPPQRATIRDKLANFSAFPDFGGKIPRDFCDGKPMRYRRTADGYELWSIALNCKG